MLSLNQAQDLKNVLSDSEIKTSLQFFIHKQRMYFVDKMVTALHANDCEKAKYYAAQDEAYADLLPLLLHFAESELNV